MADTELSLPVVQSMKGRPHGRVELREPMDARQEAHSRAAQCDDPEGSRAKRYIKGPGLSVKMVPISFWYIDLGNGAFAIGNRDDPRLA